MNRTTRTILALAAVLSAALLAVLPASPAQASSSCFVAYSYDEERVELTSAKDIEVWTQMDYFHCKNDQTNNRWVEPAIFHYGYRVYTDEGVRAGTDCTDFGTLQNVKYDLYVWDRAGNVINPSEKVLGCASDGETSNRVIFDRILNPRLYNCGGAPRWTDDTQVSRRLRGDVHPSLAGTMWGFTGPFLVHPKCP